MLNLLNLLNLADLSDLSDVSNLSMFSIIPVSWAPAPWAAVAVSWMIGVSLVIDGFLARRYAGGSEGRDGAMWALLSVSLGGNMALAIGLSAAGFGRIAWHPERVAAAGIVLGCAGLAVRYAAIATLGDLFTWRVTIQEHHRLVTHGIFAHLRHPSYTGGLMAALGIILALANWPALLVFCATHVPLVLRRIALEERALGVHFREEYDAYCDRTVRLVPFLF